MIINRHYRKQHYSIIFNTATGFFARIEDPGFPEPYWSELGPELMDIGITNWCDKGCTFCYRRSDTNGTHMAIQDYKSLIKQAEQIGVLQVALGGGNPNQHPEFEKVLAITKAEHGIVPSYTTNGRGLTNEILRATHRYCGAVAVSAYHPFEDTANSLRLLIDNGIKTNIHFILDEYSVDTAISWLESPPAWFRGINALILLNFKPVTRNQRNAPLANRNPRVGKVFQLASSSFPFKVGFDDCCATGLLTYGDVPKISVEACDSGRFSMYVSERMRAYPCSFMTELCEGHLVNSMNLQEIWQRGRLFVKMRESLSPKRCGNCSQSEHCMSGCPLFPEMNICDSLQDRSPVRVTMDVSSSEVVQLSMSY